MDPTRNLGWLRRRCRAAFALDVRSLAAFRMALGGILGVDCFLRTRDFGLMFAGGGVFPLDAMQRLHADPTVWSLAFLHEATWWQGVVLAFEGVAGILLAAGVCTRLATLFAWVALWSVIRRASPAACGGDVWLACQLFWSLFIPLGKAWSWDAWRRRAAGEPAVRGAVLSVATAALVLQLCAVYVSAGAAKCNSSWLFGGAVSHALSVHDHGTRLGMALAQSGLVGDPVSWAVVAIEILAPLLLFLWPTARIRLALVALFAAFHLAIGLTMTVGLFVPIGIAAWLPLLPARFWDRGWDDAAARAPARGLGRPAAWLCGAALALAAVSLFTFRCWPVRLPRPVTALLNVAGLHQDWRMFGTVACEEQWVYARAELANGSVVDLLRRGRPWSAEPPAGGFTSLDDARWHNVCWCLGWPAQAPVAPAVAAGLARHWNAAHGPDEQVRRVEIRHARRGVSGPGALEHETLVAAWPPRDAEGRGNLDRLLESTVGTDGADAR